MKSLLLTTLVALLVLSPLVLAKDTSAISYRGHSVLRFSNLNEDQLEYVNILIGKLRLDVWSEPTRFSPFLDVRVAPEDMIHFHDLAVPFEIFIEDVGLLMERERKPSGEMHITNSVGAADNYFTKFHTFSEIHDYTKNLAENYPNLATFVPSIGVTHQNRSMFAIEFGANATAPAIVMNSAVHAREWITVTSTQYLITQLLNGYGTDPVATDLLNTFRWRIVPIMNPDGYEYTWSTNRMWRKNRRQISSICTGVDNNRNWGKGWVSQFVCDETYPGTSAFSEIETQSMAAFVRESENAIAYIDVHSYSQLWMYPWGDTSKPVKDKKVLDQVSDAAVKGIAGVNGLKFQYGSIYDVIYPVSGGSIDYTYDYGVKYSFGIECRDTGKYGFVQPPEAIVPAGKEMTAGFIAMAQAIKKIEGL